MPAHCLQSVPIGTAIADSHERLVSCLAVAVVSVTVLLAVLLESLVSVCARFWANGCEESGVLEDCS